jgi:hypothetical protein
MQLASSAREDVINFPHDPLRSLNRSGNQGLDPRARFGIEEIVGVLEMPRYDDSRDNRQHTFAALVNTWQIYVRLLFV